MRHLLLLILVSFSMTGCVTDRRMTTVPADLTELQVADVRAILDAGNYMEALQHVDYLRRTATGYDAAELSRLDAQARTDLRRDLLTAIGEGAHADVLRLYRSAQALGAALLEDLDLSLSGIAEDLIRDHLDDDDLLTALLSFAEAVEESVLEPAQIEALRAEFAGAGAGRLADRILGRVSSTGSNTMEVLRGTATIWVDKGIKIEGGVGYPERAIGSGFFVDRTGLLLTNYHVIESEVDPKYEGYSRLYVRLPGRSEERVPAKVVGWDRVFDVALLKVELDVDYAFPLVADPPVRPGQQVFAIGSPIDPFLENTVTSGIVSATGRRRFLQMGDVIQVDAAVNPGNSGGPLLDEQGEVLGIVFAGIKPFEGLNFAIPVHWVRRVLPELLQGNEVVHPWLGLALVVREGRLEVVYTVPGSPAFRGGLREGDLITSFGGRSFDTVRDLQDYLLTFQPHTAVRVSWSREGTAASGVFALGERPISPTEHALARDARLNLMLPLFGMKLKRSANFLWETEYVAERVVPGSVADNTGVSAGDAMNIQSWRVDLENRFVFLQVFVKKRTSGFLEDVIQLAAYLDLDNFV
jgi:S1-C subfamily serine protease